jgi:TolB-like protein
MRDALEFDGVKPSPEVTLPVRFAGLVLSLDGCMLARDSGDAIPLTRGEFALLRMFVTGPGRVINRDTLLDAFSDRRFEPFDRSIDVLVGRLRKKIEADPKQPRLIVTVAGEGYRFDGLRFTSPQIAKLADADGTAKRESGPPCLSIVVLPFANLGGDHEQEYFVDGVTESLTTDLSRISGAFVIGRSTAFTYKGKAIDLKHIGRELNVRYVLEGSVQRAGNRMRVNVQLLEAETASHLWAERFDKPVADLFDMQDEVVARLAGALKAQLVAAEARRAERASEPDSMDLYFQGRAWLNRGSTTESRGQARRFFERALALDPGNIDARVGAAWVDVRTGNSYTTDDPTACFAAAEVALTKTLSVAPEHAMAHHVLGLTLISTNRAAQGIAECERALALDRNLAMALATIGLAKYTMGRGEETEHHVQEALRLSPRDTNAYRWIMYAGFAKLLLGADEEAVARLRRSVEMNRNFPLSHFYLAAALAHLGRLDEAWSALQAGLALDPAFTSSRYRARVSSDNPSYLTQRDYIRDGMSKAGLPEG